MLLRNLISAHYSLVNLQVLTDLVDYWCVFWLDGASIMCHHFSDRRTAISFLNSFVAKANPLASSGVAHSSILDQRRPAKMNDEETDYSLPEGAEDLLSPSELHEAKTLQYMHQLSVMFQEPLPTLLPPMPGLYVQYLAVDSLDRDTCLPDCKVISS